MSAQRVEIGKLNVTTVARWPANVINAAATLSLCVWKSGGTLKYVSVDREMPCSSSGRVTSIARRPPEKSPATWLDSRTKRIGAA